MMMSHAHSPVHKLPQASKLLQRKLPARPVVLYPASAQPLLPNRCNMTSGSHHHMLRRVRAAAEPSQVDSIPPTMQLGIPGLIPQDVKLELKTEEESNDLEWNPETKTLRFPSIIGGTEPGARRSRLVIFTCEKCGGRTARHVNPLAWDKGLVMGQCAQCEVWHVLSSNDPKIYEEIRYSDPENRAAYANLAVNSADESPIASATLDSKPAQESTLSQEDTSQADSDAASDASTD